MIGLAYGPRKKIEECLCESVFVLEKSDLSWPATILSGPMHCSASEASDLTPRYPQDEHHHWYCKLCLSPSKHWTCLVVHDLRCVEPHDNLQTCLLHWLRPATPQLQAPHTYQMQFSWQVQLDHCYLCSFHCSQSQEEALIVFLVASLLSSCLRALV